MQAPDSTTVETLARHLGEGTSRRGVVRLLGRLTAVGAVSALGASRLGESAEARKGKRRNKKRKRQPTQTPGDKPRVGRARSVVPGRWWDN